MMVLVFLFVVILQRTFKKNQFSVMNGRAVCLLVLFPAILRLWSGLLDIFCLLIIRHNQKQFVRIFAAKVRRCNYSLSLPPFLCPASRRIFFCSSERAGV